jgi:para-nitrobenzyl esterase
MMKQVLHTLLAVVFTVYSIQLSAQGCDEFRYLNDIATTISTTTVQFGQNVTGGGETQDLFMDVYTPDGDTETTRPVIIYAFGGSFIGGSRSDDYVVGFCERYARRGYVTVGVDYRLYNLLQQGIPDSLGMIDEVIKAVADMKAAVRYLRKSADEGNPYGIDTDKIYVGGLSAGAIAASHTAYINDVLDVPDYIVGLLDNNGGINGDTDLPGDSHLSYNSEVQAVVNMSGALHRASFMKAGDPPLVSIHGNQDETVPYGYDFAVIGIPIVTVQGSSYMHARAQEVGISSELYIIDEPGHTEFYFDEPYFTDYENMIINFLHDVTCTSVSNENLEDVSASVNVYPNPAAEMAVIAIDASLGNYDLTIVDQLGKTVRNINNINEANFTLARANLASGIYYLQLRFEDNELAPANKRVAFK